MADDETFTLSDLTEEFFCRLCYVEQMRSTGLGGPGHILMVAEDGCEYLLGTEGYDECNPQKTVPLLTFHGERDKEKYRKIYCLEDNGWTYVGDYATDILIRNDLYEKMNRLYYNSEHRKLEYGDGYKLLQCVLRPEYGLQRKVYIKTQEKWDEIELEHRKAMNNRKRIALAAEDIEWNPIHVNNLLYNPIVGIYGFLFKKQENGEITGYKWTIVFQYQESGQGGQKEEAYNLYFKEYRDVAGVLGYRKPGYIDLQCYEKSTIRDGVHSYGKFVHSYKTMGLAKEGVLRRNASIGWGDVNLANIIRVSMDEHTISEMEKDYDAKITEKCCSNIEKNITFKELRSYLSKLNRLSICILETSCYENFLMLKDVPHTYDGYYVYGIGMIESEFYKVGKCDYAASGQYEDLVFVNCMEIVLSIEPKSVLIKREKEEAESYDWNKDRLQTEAAECESKLSNIDSYTHQNAQGA